MSDDLEALPEAAAAAQPAERPESVPPSPGELITAAGVTIVVWSLIGIFAALCFSLAGVWPLSLLICGLLGMNLLYLLAFWMAFGPADSRGRQAALASLVWLTLLAGLRLPMGVALLGPPLLIALTGRLLKFRGWAAMGPGPAPPRHAERWQFSIQYLLWLTLLVALGATFLRIIEPPVEPFPLLRLHWLVFFVVIYAAPPVVLSMLFLWDDRPRKQPEWDLAAAVLLLVGFFAIGGAEVGIVMLVLGLILTLSLLCLRRAGLRMSIGRPQERAAVSGDAPPPIDQATE